VSLLLLLVLLPMLGVVLPIFLLIFAWPLALIALIVGLVKLGSGAAAS